MTLPTDSIMWIDVAIIAFYIIFVVWGAKKGFLRQIVSVFGVLLSFYFAWRLCPVLAKYFGLWPRVWTPMQDTGMADAVYQYANQIAWFLLAFLILRLVFFLLEQLAKGIQKVPVLKQVSGLLGGVLGAVSATIWILIICVFLNTSLFTNGPTIISQSYLGNISTFTTNTLSFLTGPVMDSGSFSKFFNDVSSMDDQDRTFVDTWLKDHGFETVEEQGEPDASASPSSSTNPSTPTPTPTASSAS